MALYCNTAGGWWAAVGSCHCYCAPAVVCLQCVFVIGFSPALSSSPILSSALLRPPARASENNKNTRTHTDAHMLVYTHLASLPMFLLRSKNYANGIATVATAPHRSHCHLHGPRSQRRRSCAWLPPIRMRQGQRSPPEPPPPPSCDALRPLLIDLHRHY